MEGIRDLPAEVAEFVLWLEDRGYSVEESRSGGMQGSRAVVRGRAAEVEVTTDRGQAFVSYRPRGVSQWYRIDRWSACLGIATAFHNANGTWRERLATSWQLGPQIEFTKRYLTQIEAACEESAWPAMRRCLGS